MVPTSFRQITRHFTERKCARRWKPSSIANAHLKKQLKLNNWKSFFSAPHSHKIKIEPSRIKANASERISAPQKTKSQRECRCSRRWTAAIFAVLLNKHEAGIAGTVGSSDGKVENQRVPYARAALLQPRAGQDNLLITDALIPHITTPNTRIEDPTKTNSLTSTATNRKIFCGNVLSSVASSKTDFKVSTFSHKHSLQQDWKLPSLGSAMAIIPY